MIDSFIENIEAYLRLNAIGDMSDRLTIDYIQMSLKNYKTQRMKQPKKTTQDLLQSRKAVTTYCAGTNPLD